ncbi:AAA family ATPase [Streptomyces sp. NRRL F-5630]|uniref:AAA family ATPase n=1 Tax=Streptomyces sp. NRRL F-5630 TaxID=1463864 RepID=UPI003D7120D5
MKTNSTPRRGDAERLPRALLMTGLQGAGKTTLARALEKLGFQRLCPDEEMFRRYGHYGRDFPRGEFRIREEPVLKDIALKLQVLLAEGHDVVVDHGFWTPSERRKWTATVVEAGGEPVLVYLPASHEVRWERIRQRNDQSLVDPNSIEFSEEDLLRHARRFESPDDDEPHITYNGRVEDLVAALQLNPEYEHNNLPHP